MFQIPGVQVQKALAPCGLHIKFQGVKRVVVVHFAIITTFKKISWYFEQLLKFCTQKNSIKMHTEAKRRKPLMPIFIVNNNIDCENCFAVLSKLEQFRTKCRNNNHNDEQLCIFNLKLPRFFVKADIGQNFWSQTIADISIITIK